MQGAFSHQQTAADFSPTGLIRNDYELNGTINRAAQEGAKFALILAMLEPDCTFRPQVEKTAGEEKSAQPLTELNYYRPNPLKADDAYWAESRQTSQLIQQGQVKSAQLWLAMHPEPLSQKNNPHEIDPQVIKNCSVNAQARMHQAKQNLLKVDETGLYDILQSLEPALSA